MKEFFRGFVRGVGDGFILIDDLINALRAGWYATLEDWAWSRAARAEAEAHYDHALRVQQADEHYQRAAREVWRKLNPEHEVPDCLREE